ncbi:hypothetical protein L1F30_08075 [Simiduia sp. 21SJ11W-1]|uniref:PA3496 family putative envelope integrity protein n=1 Tax=Simiduia sp. 21SJ11W-1 TaxID=2909669 RepID=UPI00209E90C9|nr:hypothetical protein [Simiduia sp. 21SJ11W-1]UTA49482.1 hypothetical protein L1F30_08075 [Simiduia sp. 21SJ11W-1]
MSGIELSVGFDDSDDLYLSDSDDDQVETKVAAHTIDPRRRLEERLEEMRLKRELRELDLDFKI